MYLTFPQVCERIGRSRSTVRRLIAQRKLVAIKTTTSPQGRVKITVASVEAYEERAAAEHGTGEQVAG